MNRFTVWPLTAAMTLLAGCAIPPRLAHPDMSAAAPLAGVPASTDAAWPGATWWQRYHDDQLNDLEARALQTAPTLAVARASICAPSSSKSPAWHPKKSGATKAKSAT